MAVKLTWVLDDLPVSGHLIILAAQTEEIVSTGSSVKGIAQTPPSRAQLARLVAESCLKLHGLVPMLSDKLLCNGTAAGCGSRGVGRLRYTQTLMHQDLLTHRVTRPACSRSFRLCPLHPAAAVCFCCCTYSSACMPHKVIGWAQPLLQTGGMPAGPDQKAIADAIL